MKRNGALKIRYNRFGRLGRKIGMKIAGARGEGVEGDLERGGDHTTGVIVIYGRRTGLEGETLREIRI